MILAGDVGGTKTNLALFEVVGGRLQIVEQQSFSSHGWPGLETMLLEFTSQTKSPLTAACFGVAGPVINRRCEATNLPWIIDAASIAGVLHAPKVGLINDLEANGHGIPVLSPDEFLVLNVGDSSRPGNAALISAGTGLGKACLFWTGQYHWPSASEGGHVDYAPHNELEIELLRYLLRQYSHVSVERIISGLGLVNIYNFLRDSGYADEPDWLANELAEPEADRNAVITRTALENRSDLCVKTLDVFVSLYGAEAGNLALTLKALGGVYVGGGIAPKILPKMTDGTFMKAFVDKGRMSPLMETIPVKLILNDKTALLGAANFALHYLE